jgi:hypothetical protein
MITPAARLTVLLLVGMRPFMGQGAQDLLIRAARKEIGIQRDFMRRP